MNNKVQTPLRKQQTHLSLKHLLFFFHEKRNTDIKRLLELDNWFNNRAVEKFLYT